MGVPRHRDRVDAEEGSATRGFGVIGSCSICHHLAELVRGLCRDCLEHEDQDFLRVREWVREHPGASVEETSGATGVTAAAIIGFVHSGRLEWAQWHPEDMTCEVCGAAGTLARHCLACHERLMNGFGPGSSLAPLVEAAGAGHGGMYSRAG